MITKSRLLVFMLAVAVIFQCGCAGGRKMGQESQMDEGVSLMADEELNDHQLKIGGFPK